jgi:RNA polymerase sigma-70 factor (ECF subfamily)
LEVTVQEGIVDSSRATRDAALIQRSCAEPQLFALIFDRHSAEIFRYAYRRVGAEVADDVVAETFLTAFRRRHSYRVDSPDARPWLYGIANLVIRSHWRAERRLLRALARLRPDALAQNSHEPETVARLSAQANEPALAAALRRLNKNDRDVLLLHAWADLTYAEIANVLDVPIGTVRSRLSRARQRMRAALGTEFHLDVNAEER